MSQEVKIIFKIEGLETYIDDLETLNDVLDKVKKSTKDASKETEKLEEDTKEASQETGFFQGKMNELRETFGKIKADFKLLGDGVKSFFSKGVSGAKALKIAFASTGIGLLVIAVVSLIDYFRNTEEGSKKLQVIFTAFGIIVNKLVGFIADLGGKLFDAFTNPKQAINDFVALLKNIVTKSIENLLGGIGKLGEALLLLFKGEFSQALDTAKQGVVQLGQSIPIVVALEGAFEGLGDEINNAVNSATALVNAQRELEKLENRLVISQAKLNKELELNQRIAEDTTLSYEERKEALDKVNAANIQLAQNEKQLADARVKALQLELQATSSDEERRRIQGELAVAQAEAINKETELGIKRQEAAKISRELSKEEVDRQNAVNAILADLRNENIVDEEEAAIAALNRAKEASLQELENLRATQEEKDALIAEYAGLEQKIRDEFRQKEEDKQKAALENERQIRAALVGESEDELQRELDNIEKFYNDLVLKAGENAALVEEINAAKNKALEEANDEFRKKEAQKEREQALANVNNALNLAAKGIQALADLNEATAGETEAEQKKAFNRNKALQIGLATIQTAQAVTAALTAGGNPIKLATGAQFIEAAIVAASGLAQIIKIKNTQFQSTAPPPDTNITPPNIPQVNPQGALSGLNNQFANLQEAGAEVVPGQPAQPIRAYVIGTEVQSSLEANNQLEKLSRL